MAFLDGDSDEATLRELGNRIARYRLNRNLTQSALAEEAGISKRTIIRVEHGHSTQTSNLIRVLRALNLLQNLEALIPQPVASPVQQVRMQGKMRQRASSKPAKAKNKEPWSWEEERGDDE